MQVMEVLQSHIVLLITILNTVLGLKVWLPNTNIDLNINYKDHTLPCGNQRVVFPSVLNYPVTYGSSASVKGIVFPSNGVISMAKDGKIVLGPEGVNTTCEEKDSIYIGDLPTDWLDPDAWNSVLINKATPDAERIPCQYDNVIFPPKSQFTLILPDIVQTVKSIKIENELVDQIRFDQFMQVGSAYGSDAKFILNKYWESGVVIKDTGCHKFVTCVCQTNEFDVNCKRKMCPEVKCLNPVRPVGNCCFICGGVLQVKLDESNVGIDKLQVLTYNIVYQFGGLDQLAIHIGRLRNKMYQVVVIEMGEYDGTSAEVVKILKDELASQHSIYDAIMLESGSPGSMEKYGIKIAAVMLLAVTLVFATVILFYHPPSSYRHDGVEVFARFHNREGSTDDTSTVSRENLSLTASFRNPLYYAKRNEQQVSQPVEQRSTFEPRLSDLLAQEEM